MMSTTTPSPSRPRSGGSSCLLAALLLLVYVAASIALLLLPTGFIGPVFVVGGFFFVAVMGFHYLVWGRWLSRLLAEDEPRHADSLPSPPRKPDILP
ncbi:MAG: hypothetical protein AB7O38_07120 [Pirellulaceae bacterium]